MKYADKGRKIIERVFGKDDVTVESVIQFSYDGWDRVVCKAVRMNPAAFGSPPSDPCEPGGPGIYGPDRISRYGYDGLDQVVTAERALGTPLAQTYVTNEYGGRGKLTSQTDAKGNRTELRYDSNGRLNKRVFPNLAFPGTVNENDFIRYTNDKNGNVLVERKRDSTTITNTYDNNNRLVFKDLSDNTYSGDIAYDYDLRGLALASCFGTNQFDDDCDDSGAGETNDFDGFGNLESRISRMGGTSRALSYQYDLEGNRTRINHPGGVYFTYNRDGLNRVCSLGESAAAQSCDTPESPVYLTMRYSKEGRRDRIFRPNGAVTLYDTDNALRLDHFSQEFPASTNNLTNSFEYNPASQVTSLTQSNVQYNYTEAQNRVGVYGVNALNRYTSIDGVTVAYDLNGNLTADGAGMTYTYDMENRLVATSGTKSSTLSYDVLGRLAQISVDGTTTQFHYDGDALVGEYVVGTGQTRRYVHSGGVDEPLVQYNGYSVGPSYRRYLHADHQGSIIVQSNNSGAVEQRNAYDPYGIPASTNDGRFGYTGQTWIKELGLNYYKARFYSPKIGRFLQTDPIFYKDDMNLYAYVSNDPANKTDPTGTKCNTEGTECTADTAIPQQTKVDVSHDPAVDAAVITASTGYQKPVNGGEPTGVVKTTDRDLEVIAVSSKQGQTAAAATARFSIKDAVAAVHGHLTSSLVDVPSANKGYGDTESIKAGIPTYTVAGMRVGVHDAPGGQLRFTMVAGVMTATEMKKIQANLNKQQKLFQ